MEWRLGHDGKIASSQQDAEKEKKKWSKYAQT
jgi:hypothetical protein